MKAYEAESAVVIRDGKIQEIPSAQLVCGDLVQVSEGQQVPADLRMLELVSVTFRIDQSILTGTPFLSLLSLFVYLSLVFR